jgi:copper chaperone CopZ
MAGPATNIATLGAVYRTLGKTPLVIYLSTIVGGSILFGLLFDGLIPIESLVQVGHVHAGPVSIASAVLLIGMVAWFAFSDARLAVTRLGQGWAGAAVTTNLELNVQGMTCGGCARKVEKGLLAVDGVDRVTVDQPAGRVQVSGSIEPLIVIQAVEAAGFSAQVRPPGLALYVGGMTCGGCARKVKAKLGELDDVQGVEVDLDGGIVRVIGPVSLDQVTVTVREAGFAPGAEL